MNTFEQIHKKYEAQITQICKAICNNHYKHKVELDDLIQEAMLKLWQLSEKKDFDINNVKQVNICIRNRLLDYIKVETTTVVNGKRVLKPLYAAEPLEILDNYV